MKIRFKNKHPIYPICIFYRKKGRYDGIRKFVCGDTRTIRRVVPVNARWVDLILPNGNEIIEVSRRSFEFV